MYWKGLSLLLLRLGLIISLLVFYHLNVEGLTYFILSFPIMLVGSFMIYYVRGSITAYSYVLGYFLIIALYFLTNYIYGEATSLLGYCFLYSALIPLIISLTIHEILFFIELGFTKPIVFLLVTLRLNFAYLERFSNVLETYRAYYRSKYRIYVYGVRSIIGSLPYMVIVLAEYLYTNLSRLFK